MDFTRLWLRSLLTLANESVLLMLAIVLSMLIAHLIPSLKLAEEKRVLDAFNIRFEAANEELQRMQSGRELQHSRSGNQSGVGSGVQVNAARR